MSATSKDGTSARPRKLRPRPRRKVLVTQAIALELLASAVSYCQQAGMSIAAQNATNASGDSLLQLYIPNAYYVLLDDGTAAFRIGNPSIP